MLPSLSISWRHFDVFPDMFDSITDFSISSVVRYGKPGSKTTLTQVSDALCSPPGSGASVVLVGVNSLTQRMRVASEVVHCRGVKKFTLAVAPQDLERYCSDPHGGRSAFYLCCSATAKPT